MTSISKDKEIYFRCDFGGNIGRGHLSRCLNLAYAFEQKGYKPIFIIRKRPSIAHEVLAYKTIWLQKARDVSSANVESWLSGSIEQEASDVLDILGKHSVLILDHYALGYDYQNIIKEHGHKVVLFQDVYSEDFIADVLINYNVGTEVLYIDIAKKIKSTTMLTGTSYTPLAPVYSREHINRMEQVVQVKAVGIYLGGIDKSNLEKLAYSLNDVEFLKLKNLCWIVNTDEEKRIVQKNLHLSTLSVQVRIPDMFELYNKVQLFIGSCGLSFLERACLGLWQLNFLIADNQKGIANHIYKNNLGGYIGDIRLMDAQQVSLALTQASELPVNEYRSSVEKAFLLTDGQGASKIFQKIEELL